MMHLQFKFNLFLIVWLMCSTTLLSGGLSVFRTEPPSLFNLEVPTKSQSSLERLVQETTSSVVQTFKSAVRSILRDSFLDFLLGKEATKETVAQELERLETKVENAERLTGKEEASLDLLTNGPDYHTMECFSAKAPRNDKIGIIVLAPGQELLQYLNQAIKQAANSEHSEEQIKDELNELWNPKTYKNQTRVVELRKLVTELIGCVIDSRRTYLEYRNNLQTFGEYVAKQLQQGQFNFSPALLVLSAVILDSVLVNSEHIDLSCDMVINLLGASIYVSQGLMHQERSMNSLFDKSNADWSSPVWFIAPKIFRPGLLFDVVTKLQNIWTRRVNGESFNMDVAQEWQQLPGVTALEQANRKKIGQGNYAQVVLTHCGRYAVKVFAVQEIKGTDGINVGFPPTDLFRELLRPESNHILPIHRLDSSPWNAIDLFSPYCSCGDFEVAIRSRRTQVPGVARQYLFQILRVLAELERAEIIHGDIKPKNLFVTADGLKLGDFGLAFPGFLGVFETRLVTPGYRAPEVLFGIGPITHAIDVFAAGVVFWEMLTGEPFSTPMNREEPTEYDWVMNQRAAMNVITGIPDEKGWPELYQKYSKSTVEEWREEITNRNRKRLVEVHRQFIESLPREALNLFLRMTVWNPEKRIKASEALRHPWFRDLVSQGSNPSQQDDD